MSPLPCCARLPPPPRLSHSTEAPRPWDRSPGYWHTGLLHVDPQQGPRSAQVLPRGT